MFFSIVQHNLEADNLQAGNHLKIQMLQQVYIHKSVNSDSPDSSEFVEVLLTA